MGYIINLRESEFTKKTNLFERFEKARLKESGKRKRNISRNEFLNMLVLNFFRTEDIR